MRTWLTIACLLAVCLPTVAQSGEVTDAEIPPLTTSWQALPSEINQVYVAPDGRLCFQREPESYPLPESPVTQQQIAAEYARKSPRFRTFRLALFEPGGRIWFHETETRSLRGYDGKEWISHTIEDPMDAVRGRCLTRGGLIDADANRFVAGVAWFLGARGIYRFDGKAWKYDKLFDDQPSYDTILHFAVSADGQRAVAGNARREFWWFANGKWTRREVSQRDNPSVQAVAIANSGDIWVQPGPGDLHHLRIDATGQITEERSDANQFVSVGAARVANVHALYQDNEGRTFFAADSISGDGQPARPGVLILDVHGKTRIVRGENIVTGWRTRYAGFPPPILSKSGEQVWLSNRATERPAAKLNFADGKFVDELPNQDVGCLHAVGDDGRVFVSRGNLGFSRQAIMAYSPNAPRNKELKVKRVELPNHENFFSDDGFVWMIDAQKRLVRTNGAAWQVFRQKMEADSLTFLEGLDGVMLIVSGDNVHLYQHEKELASGPLFEILEDHQPLLVRAFDPAREPGAKDGSIALAGHPDGALWCLYNGTVRVLSKKRWLDATIALKQSGLQGGICSYMAAIGNGRRVYVSDLGPRYYGGRSFVCRFEAGKLSIDATDHLLYPRGVRDRKGGLWIPSYIVRPDPLWEEQLALRLVENGPGEPLKNSGWAQLADPAGNVWLSEIQGKLPSYFHLWRDGKITQQLEISGYESGGILFSDRPGSVYANTPVGLQHWVAEEPEFKTFRYDRTYGMSKVAGKTTRQAYNKRDTLLLETYIDTPERTCAVYFIKIPPSDD